MNGSGQIKIIVITPSQNDAERIEGYLRNAGHPVHARWLQNIDDLPALLPDASLLLCTDQLPNIKIREVTAMCKRIVPGMPMLVISDMVDVMKATEYMQMGARDLVSLQYMDHLQLVMLRELDFSKQFRTLNEARSRLQQVEHRHDSLLQDTAEALAYVQEGIHIRVNPAYAKLFGYVDAKAVEGLPLMDIIAINDRPKLKQLLRNCAKGKIGKESFAYLGQTVDDQVFPIKIRLTPSQIDDEDCIEVLAIKETPIAVAVEQPPAAVTPVTVTPEIPAVQITEPLPPVTPPPAPATSAGHDAASYTGQHGRQSLYAAVETALKNNDQNQGMTAVLFLRSDNLERLEQRLGFIEADKIFNELAAFLLEWCGNNDRAYRFSVGEFVVIATRADLKNLEISATELRTLVAKQVFGGTKQPTSLTVSMACLPLVWHTDVQQILKEARQRVLGVQESSGSGIYIETPQEKEKTGTPQQQDKLWVARIKAAFDQNKFRLVHKSIVSLEGEASQFYDVLLRMINEKGEEVSALDFLPVAERNGLMPTIDQWVIQQAIVSMSTRPPGEQDFGLFIRVSDSSIDAGDKFLPWLLKQIKAYPVRPENLLLTFNEQGLQDHLAKAKIMVAGLRKLRIRIAISHFGVTQQSLELLEQIPVDYLRLDEAIIKSLSNPKSSERVSDILRQAREKGSRIVAKQVTDAQTMAMLWTLGVHFIEGDYVQDPVLAQTA